MPVILDRSNCQSPSGWIDFDDNGIINYNEPWFGKRACEITRVGPTAWNTLGNQRRRKQVGAAGMSFFLDYYFAGAGVDFVMGFRRSTGLGMNTTTGVYNNGSGGLYLIENGSTPAPNAAPANVGWILLRGLWLPTGQLDFAWISPLSPAWTSLGSTVATDWIGADTWFSTNCFSNGSVGPSYIDNLLWLSA